MFHSLAFMIGYFVTRANAGGEDAIPVARCISLETGMQVCLSCKHASDHTVLDHTVLDVQDMLCLAGTSHC